jgi:hypothetical protein
VLEGGAEERLAGQEHDDELGRVVELAPVRLARELRHVVAHLPRVVREPGRTDGIVALERFEVGDEGRLRVDHDALAAGQPDTEVGADASCFGGCGVLLEKVAMLEHPGELDDTAQLDLAPVAANVRLAQRAHEVACLAGQRREPRAQRAHLLVEARTGRRTVLLDLGELAVHLLERLDDRLHEIGNRPLPLLQVGRRPGLVFPERCPGQAEH